MLSFPPPPVCCIFALEIIQRAYDHYPATRCPVAEPEHQELSHRIRHGIYLRPEAGDGGDPVADLRPGHRRRGRDRLAGHRARTAVVRLQGCHHALSAIPTGEHLHGPHRFDPSHLPGRPWRRGPPGRQCHQLPHPELPDLAAHDEACHLLFAGIPHLLCGRVRQGATESLLHGQHRGSDIQPNPHPDGSGGQRGLHHPRAIQRHCRQTGRQEACLLRCVGGRCHREAVDLHSTLLRRQCPLAERGLGAVRELAGRLGLLPCLRFQYPEC